MGGWTPKLKVGRLEYMSDDAHPNGFGNTTHHVLMKGVFNASGDAIFAVPIFVSVDQTFNGCIKAPEETQWSIQDRTRVIQYTDGVDQ